MRERELKLTTDSECVRWHMYVHVPCCCACARLAAPLALGGIVRWFSLGAFFCLVELLICLGKRSCGASESDTAASLGPDGCRANSNTSGLGRRSRYEERADMVALRTPTGGGATKL